MKPDQYIILGRDYTKISVEHWNGYQNPLKSHIILYGLMSLKASMGVYVDWDLLLLIKSIRYEV